MLFTPRLSLVVWAAMCEVDREVHKMSFGGGIKRAREIQIERGRQRARERECIIDEGDNEL